MKNIQFEQLNSQLEFVAQAVAKHEGKFEKIDKTLERLNERFDKIDSLLMNHDHRLFWIEENMATKDDIKGLVGIIDHWGKSIQDIKVDHTFSVEWLTRMQEQLGWHEQDIRKVKLMLNLA